MPAWVAGNPVAPEVRLGKVLQNEFHILRILGEGELGVTYEAENSRLKGKFAVLMLRRELKPTQGMMLSVQKDLRAAQPLQMQGLMPVKMIVDQFDIPGFATELLDGETLRQRLRRGPLRAERAIAIVLHVAKALDSLHKAGAVHGDLRPENIFLVRPGAKSTFAGKVVIVEHSLHHLRRRPAGLDDQLPLYKLMYRSPEMLSGETGPHPGGDVFVLGAILHECLTGRPAFFDEVADFVIDNLHQPPKALQPNPQSGLSQELCQPLDELTQCACARDPKERLPDMASLVLGLEALVRSKGLKLPEVLTESPESSTPESNQTEQRMHRLLERRSGVFPVLGPPPSEPAKPAAPAPPSPPVAPSNQPAVPSGPSVAAKPLDPLAPLQAITAPKKKVTQILQKLSSAFPVLTVSPDGSAIEERTVQPAGVPQALKQPTAAEAVTMVGEPTKSVGAPPVVPAPIAPEPISPAPISPAVESAAVAPLPVAAPPIAPLHVELPHDLKADSTALVSPPAPTAKDDEPTPAAPVSLDAATQPKAEVKAVLKANVAEALSRLRKPGAVFEPKTPPPAALPFEVSPVVAPAEPPKTAPPIAPIEAASANPVAPATDKPASPPPAVPEAKPSSPRRVSESTLQVDNVDDLLVSMPSLLAIPIVPSAPPPTPPSARSPSLKPVEPPQTLSSVPTSVAIDSLRRSHQQEQDHDPALLSAPTKPLLPAMLGELLTPPLTKAPPVEPESLLTPPVTAAPNVQSLHEAPTRAKLPLDELSAMPTQAVVEALPLSTPNVVPVIPPEAQPSGKVDQATGDSIHNKPTAASIPSLDLLSRALAGPSSQPPSNPPSDPQRLLESNPIIRAEPAKESPPPSLKPFDAAPEPKLVLPAQVSTAHTSLTSRPRSGKPVNVPQAPEPGLRSLLLRNQEIVAAAVGALLVLLIGLLFSMFIR